VPTRELAQQVTDALAPYARTVRLRLATVVGGMSIGRQAAALRDGAEVVVATPGLLKNLIDRGDCRLGQVEITVLDEADQMADMGFMPQVTALLEQIRPEGQRMLFSATLDRNVDLLVHRYLTDPVVHSVDPSAGAVTTMEHHVLHVQETDKHRTTIEIAAREGRVIMFLDTKHAVDRLTRDLLISGAADHKDYLHRGGRTARAGESGSVVTLVTPGQSRSMTRLMAAAGIVPRTAQVRPGGEEWRGSAQDHRRAGPLRCSRDDFRRGRPTSPRRRLTP
jgi:superfamily II DNA/RNA helicase